MDCVTVYWLFVFGWSWIASGSSAVMFSTYPGTTDCGMRSGVQSVSVANVALELSVGHERVDSAAVVQHAVATDRVAARVVQCADARARALV